MNNCSDSIPAAPESLHPSLWRASQLARSSTRCVNTGHVEVHARDTTQRPIVLSLTATQALTLGAHVSAHAAIALDRSGAKLDTALAALTATGTAAPVIPGPTDPR